jgi:hypothetical protein
MNKNAKPPKKKKTKKKDIRRTICLLLIKLRSFIERTERDTFAYERKWSSIIPSAFVKQEWKDNVKTPAHTYICKVPR